MTAGELTQVLTAFAILVSSVAGLVVAVRTGQKVSATHDLVNGASEQINALREARGHEAGLAEGLRVQDAVLHREVSGPGKDNAPTRRAHILSGVPPASADIDAVSAPRNYLQARRARSLRETGPE